MNFICGPVLQPQEPPQEQWLIFLTNFVGTGTGKPNETELTCLGQQILHSANTKLGQAESFSVPLSRQSVYYHQ